MNRLTQEQVDKLILSYKGKRTVDLTYFNLTGLSFENRELSNVDFSHSIIESVNFTNTTFSHCKFNNCILAACIFTRASFISCSIKSSIIDFSLFLNAKIDNTSFYLSSLSSVIIKSSDFHLTIFDRCSMPDILIQESNIQSLEIKYSSVIRGNIENCDIINYIKIERCNLEFTRFKTTDLKYLKVDTSTNLYGINVEACQNEPLFAQLQLCPSTAFTAYTRIENYIVVLEIPLDALRVYTVFNTIKVNKAKVVKIEHINGKRAKTTRTSTNFYVFEIGTTIENTSFTSNKYKLSKSDITCVLNKSLLK